MLYIFIFLKTFMKNVLNIYNLLLIDKVFSKDISSTLKGLTLIFIYFYHHQQSNT